MTHPVRSKQTTVLRSYVRGSLLYPRLRACFRIHVVAQVNVLTAHNYNARTGLNTNETLLTPITVSSNGFGKIFTQPPMAMFMPSRCTSQIFPSRAKAPQRRFHRHHAR